MGSGGELKVPDAVLLVWIVASRREKGERGVEVLYLLRIETQILNTNTPRQTQPPVSTRSTSMFEWAKNNKSVLYLQDADGDENWHIYASDLDTGVVRDMTRVLNKKTSGCLFLA